MEDNKDWKEFWKFALYRYWKLSAKKDKSGTSPRERHWQAVKDTIQPVYANRYPSRRQNSANYGGVSVKDDKVAV